MTIARPKTLPGEITEVQTGCGSLWVTVGFKDNRPYEVFASLGKAGGCSNCQNEALTRMITLVLKSGVPLEPIIKHLSNIRCPAPQDITETEENRALSCPDAVGKVLRLYLNGAPSESSKV